MNLTFFTRRACGEVHPELVAVDGHIRSARFGAASVDWLPGVAFVQWYWTVTYGRRTEGFCVVNESR